MSIVLIDALLVATSCREKRQPTFVSSGPSNRSILSAAKPVRKPPFVPLDEVRPGVRQASACRPVAVSDLLLPDFWNRPSIVHSDEDWAGCFA
jgi:hypothetical protein